MADFAPNMTCRYKLRYNAAGRVHTMLMRVARGATAAQTASNGAAYLRGLFLAMQPTLPSDLAFLSAEVAVEDSDLFFPAAVPAAVTGAQPAANYSKQDSITHVTFSGRGALGSKVNLKLYGVLLSPDVVPGAAESDFVLLSSESTAIAAAITHLNATPALSVAIDNSVPTYSARTTVKINDFWLRQVRKGL